MPRAERFESKESRKDFAGGGSSNGVVLQPGRHQFVTPQSAILSFPRLVSCAASRCRTCQESPVSELALAASTATMDLSAAELHGTVCGMLCALSRRQLA